MQKILIIQTAFIGDVILATPVIEQIIKYNTNAKIDFLLRKGNEGLLSGHPHINRILIWNKKQKKLKGLWNCSRQIRKEQYDVIINLHRFLSSGLMIAFSGAKNIIGFSKNPLSFFFTASVPHEIGKTDQPTNLHETQRNLQLLAPIGITDANALRPKLYPSEKDILHVQVYQSAEYICIAPTSVWFTKQYPQDAWIKFLTKLPFDGNIFLLGAPTDFDACEVIRTDTKKENIVNLAGKLNLLQSAALMKQAIINYVNDSAPMHLASSVNAPVCVIFCSTIPAFGFGPLSDFAEVVETKEKLTCRPCGLHGYKACPKQHFNCAYQVDVNQLLSVFDKARSRWK